MNLINIPKVTIDAFQTCLEGMPLFDAVSIKVLSGDCVHIKGPNGIGKTKFVESLVGLHKDYMGASSITGDFTYVGTTRPFDDHRTVEDNLRFWSALSSHRNSNYDLVSDALLKKPFHMLSSGQKQLVNLQRLNFSDASIWVLDEPFSFLDEAASKKLATKMRTFCDQGGICLFTSHQTMPGNLSNRSIDLTVTHIIESLAA